MVDFSNREEVKFWLDGISPASERLQVAIVVSARAALRVAPLLGNDFVGLELNADKSHFGELALPALRAVAGAWLSARYPGFRESAPNDAIRSAGSAASKVAKSLAAIDQSAALAATAAASAAYAASRGMRAVNDAQFVAEFVARAADRAANAASDVNAAAAADALRLPDFQSVADLAGAPLWLNGAPIWAKEAWTRTKSMMLGSHKDWRVWTEWYDARLQGDAGLPTNNDFGIMRAMFEEGIWKQGPRVANAEIERFILVGSQIVDTEATKLSIIATRSALRALPLLTADDPTSDSWKSKYFLTVFRALAASWTRSYYPTSVEPWMSIAATREPGGLPTRGKTAARYAAAAAFQAAYAAGSVDPNVMMGRSNLALQDVRDAGRVFGRDAAETLLTFTTTDDVTDLTDLGDLMRLAQVPLWPGAVAPPFIRDLWDFMREGLLTASEGWEVWVDWYEARLSGIVRSREVELAYVDYARGMSSNADAKEANAKIKRLIEERESPTSAGKIDCFVSYAGADEASAREVADVLEGAGFRTVAQFKDFAIGKNFVGLMNQGLAQSARVVALYSPAYLASAHCQAEWAAAYHFDPSGAEQRLIPFMLTPTELPPLARQIIYKSLVGLDREQRKTAILSAFPRSPPARPPISAQRPAALEPEYQSGQLTLRRGNAKSSLPPESVAAALKSVALGLASLADDASLESNIDRRFLTRLRTIAAKVPDKHPDDVELFTLGHEYEELASSRRSVTEIWPTSLANRYFALTLAFDRTLRRFPKWVDFVRETPVESVSAEQAAGIAQVGKIVSEALREGEAAGIVDIRLPDSIDAMSAKLEGVAEQAGNSPDPIDLGSDLLAQDLLESVNNTIKRIAEGSLAVAAGAEHTISATGKKIGGYGRAFATSADASLMKSFKEAGEHVGPAVVKLLRRTLYATVSVGGAALEGPTVAAWLSAHYPQMYAWLDPLVKFFEHLPK